MQPVAILRLKSPSTAERTVPLVDGENTRIGRDPGNSIVLDDPAVSRVHATISASNAGVMIADNKSTNGTFVNGKKISMRHIQSGDIIDIGTYKMAVEIQAEKAIQTLSSRSNARAMTAQLKPVAVTVLLGTLLVNHDGLDAEVPADEINKHWTEQAAQVVWEFSGMLDKQICNHVVALWIGRDGERMAHHAVKAAQKIKEMTELVSKQLGTVKLGVKLILSSGHGLTGLIGGGEQPNGNKFTILGDPINTTFTLEEGVEDLTQQIVICPSTADLVKTHFTVEPLAPADASGKPQTFMIR